MRSTAARRVPSKSLSAQRGRGGERINRLLPGRDGRVVIAVRRECHPTPDGLHNARQVKGHLLRGRQGVQFDAVARRSFTSEPDVVIAALRTTTGIVNGQGLLEYRKA